MAKKKVPLERTYYPFVAKWLKRHFRCFNVATNRGLRHGRIDVVGVRDIGGDLSGEVEVIAVEVKRGSTPFSNACGQTFGYTVYANRVYLADVREKPFTQDEVLIASNLGIGLIRMRGEKCTEVLSSPFHRPISKMQLLLMEALRLGQCRFCGSLFEIGASEGPNNWTELCRGNVMNAIKQQKGLMFWNTEVSERKRKLGIRYRKDDTTTYERRFICPDCIASVFSQLQPSKTK